MNEVEEIDETFANTFEIMFTESIEEQEEVLSEDVLAEAELVEFVLKRLHRMTAGAKSLARRMYRRNKAGILKRLRKYRRSAKGRRHTAILHKILQRMGGKRRPHMRLALHQSVGERGDTFESATSVLQYAQKLLSGEEFDEDVDLSDDDGLDEAFDRTAYMKTYMRKYRTTPTWKAWYAGYREKKRQDRGQSLGRDIKIARSNDSTRDARKAAKLRVKSAFKGFLDAKGTTAGEHGERAMRSAFSNVSKVAQHAQKQYVKQGRQAFKNFGENLDLEEFDIDELGEAKIQRTRRMSGSERSAARREYRANKGELKVKRRKLRNTSKFKIHQKKLNKLRDRMGDLGAHRRISLESEQETSSLSEMLDQALGLNQE